MFIVLFHARPAHTNGPYISAPSPLYGEHYATIIGANRIRNHYDILVHIPGTHFTDGWICGPCLSMCEVRFEPETPSLILYKLNYQGALTFTLPKWGSNPSPCTSNADILTVQLKVWVTTQVSCVFFSHSVS